MRTIKEILDELYSHPELIYSDIYDKENLFDEFICLLDSTEKYCELDEEEIKYIFDIWFEEHLPIMRRKRERYFEMGEYHYELSFDIESWLDEKNFKILEKYIV